MKTKQAGIFVNFFKNAIDRTGACFRRNTDNTQFFAVYIGKVFGRAEDGRMLKGPESIVTDAFAILGLVEYHHATGNADVAAAAGAPCMYTDGSTVAVQGTT